MWLLWMLAGKATDDGDAGYTNADTDEVHDFEVKELYIGWLGE